MKIVETRTTTILNFSDSLDMADYIRNTPKRNYSRKDSAGSHNYYSTWDESLSFLENGWPEGSDLIEKQVLKIEDIIAKSILKEEYRMDVEGLFFDTGLYNSGNPECWFEPVPEPVKQETLDIIINTGYSGYISGSSVINRGAAIMSTIDSLRERFFLNLTITKFTGNLPGASKDMRINLPVDTDNLYSRSMVAFMVAHPAFLRQIIFSVWEKFMGKNDLSPYGYTKQLENLPPEIIYFPGVRNDLGGFSKEICYETPEKAAETVLAILATKGITKS
jgi:hypothetical protein